MPGLEQSSFPCLSQTNPTGDLGNGRWALCRGNRWALPRESCLPIGMEQGTCAEPGAPTAYSSLGKASGRGGRGTYCVGGQANQEIRVVLVCPELLQNSKCWGKASNEVK